MLGSKLAGVAPPVMSFLSSSNNIFFTTQVQVVTVNGHTNFDNGWVYLVATDQTTGIILDSFLISPDTGVGKLYTPQILNSTMATSILSHQFGLRNIMGHNISFEVFVSSCTFGGHYTDLYIDIIDQSSLNPFSISSTTLPFKLSSSTGISVIASCFSTSKSV